MQLYVVTVSTRGEKRTTAGACSQERINEVIRLALTNGAGIEVEAISTTQSGRVIPIGGSSH